MAVVRKFTDIFDNLTKIKIFECLVKESNLQSNITNIYSNVCGSNYQRISRYVIEMEKDGLLFIQRFGRIQIVCIDETNDTAKRFISFLETEIIEDKKRIKLEIMK